MDADTCRFIMDQIRAVEAESALQQLLDRQLDAELQNYIYQDHKDGTAESLMYQKLPPEIRSQIYSHVVAVDQSVHVFPPKGNEKHGFRLSLCEESSYDFELGNCRCDENRIGRTTQPEFFHNALFLVSRTVRREALDAFFMTNKFTFTCLYELLKFTTMFTASCSKIQHLRIFERVDDYPASEFRLEGLQNARLALKALKHLDLHIFLGSWSAYDKTYEDGLVHQLLHFALGPPPPTHARKKRCLADLDFSNFDNVLYAVKKAKVDEMKPDTTQEANEKSPNEATETSNSTSTTEKGKDKAVPDTPQFNTQTSPPFATCTTSNNHKPEPPFPIPPLRSFKAQVRMRASFIGLSIRTADPKQAYYDSLYERLINHLTDVFMDGGRKYRTVEDVPQLMEKPSPRMRDEDKPLTDKRGILFMKD